MDKCNVICANLRTSDISALFNEEHSVISDYPMNEGYSQLGTLSIAFKNPLIDLELIETAWFLKLTPFVPNLLIAIW